MATLMFSDGMVEAWFAFDPPHIKPPNITDCITLFIFILASSICLSCGYLWERQDSHYNLYFETPQNASTRNTKATDRDISKKLRGDGYECVIFWGSQSGTSERFAWVLGRECETHFGVRALVADLSDYDPKTIEQLSLDKFVIFILSTYGEGDPSDNTAGLCDYIQSIRADNVKLDHLKYCALGLGNSNYKYFNRVVDLVADSLNSAGAKELIPRKKADDADGGTEEDFQSWKDEVFTLLQRLGFEERFPDHRPSLDLTFAGEISHYLAAHAAVQAHEESGTKSAIVPLPIKSSCDLFTHSARNCLHIELDLSNSDLVYKTGDHIGVWPCNPDHEVDMLVSALGLQSCRDKRLVVVSKHETRSLKLPSPTTVNTLFRHSLEICGKVARKTALDVSQFAPTEQAKLRLLEICRDCESYKRFTSENRITLGHLLQLISPSRPWKSLPLSFVIERLKPLQPRYYSISSSSVVSPRRISVTALVLNQGLASNYLLNSSTVAAAHGAPNFKYQGVPGCEGKVFAHIRKSKFKLPVTASTALVLISAGTGFAPFRAFIQERARLHSIGKRTGQILLFFGCRDMNDFIYREELEHLQAQLGEDLEIVTAFSRANGQRIHVQHRVEERSDRIIDLLDKGANLYICGQAIMAREIDEKLEIAVAQKKILHESDARAWVEALKRKGKWKTDVWG